MSEKPADMDDEELIEEFEWYAMSDTADANGYGSNWNTPEKPYRALLRQELRDRLAAARKELA